MNAQNECSAVETMEVGKENEESYIGYKSRNDSNLQ
jgi:hypothetical protein